MTTRIKVLYAVSLPSLNLGFIGGEIVNAPEEIAEILISRGHAELCEEPKQDPKKSKSNLK